MVLYPKMCLIDLVFPKLCLGCKREGKYICRNCAVNMRLSPLVCPYCFKSSIGGRTHDKCRTDNCLDGLISVWKYEGVIRKAILALKFKFATEVAGELTSYIITELQSKSYILPNASCLVPVPLYWYRENYRGFNQSYLLGKAVSKELVWEFIPDLVIKSKSVRPQVGLKGKERRTNLRNVFEINSSRRSTLAFHRSLILFDDVYTTGSTLKEAARVLKQNGAERVWGLTVAR